MKDIDKKIQEALRTEDEELFGDGDQALLEMVADSFKGRMRGLIVIVWVATLVAFALSVFCAVRFFGTEADDVKAMMGWGFGFVYASTAVAMLKMWYWMELNRNSAVREVKRVELQIARLAKRMKEH